MEAVYQLVAAMIRKDRRSDYGREAAPVLAREIVDKVVQEIKRNGCPELDLLAAHDEPEQP